jgi:hypothetical protein
MKKCKKGMVRGFSRSLLIVRDPFAAVWNEYNNIIDGIPFSDASNRITSGSDSMEKGFELFNISLTYTKEKLMDYGSFDNLNEIMPANSAIIVSYESLINPNSDLSQKNSPQSKENVLRDILTFAGFPEVYEEKLSCAFQFIEAGQAIKDLETMNQFYLSHRSVICQLNKQFNRILQPNKFNFTRLYSEIKC